MNDSLLKSPIPFSLPRRRYLALIFVLAVLVVGTATYGIYRVESERLVSRQYETLRAMGDIKEAHIRSWLDERRDDAERMKTNPLLIRDGARLLKQPGDREAAAVLREWLQAQLMGDAYQNVLLVDETGGIILSVQDDPPGLNPATKAVLPQAVAENRAVQGDFYRRDDGKTIASDTLAPVRDRAGRLLFLVVLQSDARRFLFPLLQRWYAFTASGEAVLVRREGDRVLYLNDLRHGELSALDLSLPLTEKEIPVVQAVSGLRGSFAGRNYHGTPVLADLRGIADTPWFLVAKMDREEALADLSRHLTTFALIATLLILLTGAALAYFYRLRQARLYREAWRSQQARQESERKLSSLLANLPGMASRCRNDADWTAEFISEGCLALTGWRPEEFMNRAVSYEALIHPDDRPFVRQEMEAAVGEGCPYTIEYRIRTREGEEKWVWERGRIADATDGGMTLFDEFIIDITERKKAEESLREAQFRMAQTVDFLPDPTFVIDGEGKILTWNRAMEELTGVAAADMVGRGDYAYAVPFYGRPRPIMIDLALRHDESVASGYASFAREGDRLVSESYLPDFRGRGETWLWNTASPLRDENNRILGAIESVRDITRHKKRERELEGALSLLNTALEATADGILVVNLEGENLRWNRKIQEMFLLPGAALFRRYMAESLDYISPQLVDPATVAGRMRELFLNPAEAGLDILEFKDGRVFEAHSQPHLLGSNIVGRVLSFRDLTASRRAQEEGRLLTAQLHESQKMEAVGRLAGGIAHDFNNMLNVILGQANLSSLRIEEASPVQAHIEAITKAAQRSAELVRQLLGYARRQIVSPRIVDLNETTEEMLKMLRQLIGENVDLLWKPSGQLWPIKIDPSQVTQILTNLAVNARDAIEGHGTITMETGNVEFDDLYCKSHLGFIPGQYAMLAVSDNGCGMDKETMARIFEPFYTTKPVGVGTGLGLPTVYGIVKQNGGFINVYSEPGRGSSFKLYFPKSGEERLEEAPAPPVSLTKGSGTILLVEDEQALLEIGEEMLAFLGYRVLAAAGPLRALALVKEFAGEIDLVITDVVMPEMNGEELVRAISALRPGLKYLYMSGYTVNVIVHQGILDEGLNFIQKPFSLEEMSSKIRTILDKPR